MTRPVVAMLVALGLASCSGSRSTPPSTSSSPDETGRSDRRAAEAVRAAPDSGTLAYQRLYRRVGLRLSRATTLPDALVRKYLELPYEEGIADAAVRAHNTALLSEIDGQLASASQPTNSAPPKDREVRDNLVDPFGAKAASSENVANKRGSGAPAFEEYRLLYRRISQRLDRLEDPPRKLVNDFLAIKFQAGIMDAELRAKNVEQLNAIDRGLTAFEKNNHSGKATDKSPPSGDLTDNPFR